MKTKLQEIAYRWSFADLDGATVSLSGSRHPGTTIHALRNAPEDVAWLIGRVKHLEAQLQGFDSR